MSKPNSTHLTLLLDRSSSMRKETTAMQNAVNAFLKVQKALSESDGLSLTVSMVLFNGYVKDKAFHFLSADEAIATMSNYFCSGGTALYDAVGITAQDVATRIMSLESDAQPEKVIFAIVTDGDESGASRVHSANTVKEIVDFNEATYDWEFLYIGSNQNAYRSGQNMGIKAGKALSFASSGDGLEKAMEAICGAVTRYRQNGAPSANQFFNAEDHDFQAALGASASPTHE